MRKQNVLGVLAMVCMALLLAGCTGEGSFVESSGTGGGTGGGGTPDPGTSVTPIPRLGVLAGDGSFTPEAMRVGLTTLSAGGTTSLSVDIVDTANGNTLITEEVAVSFSSLCTGQGTALITTPITTSSGTANTTYRANGCSGTDTITATATVNGAALRARATVTVQPASIGSIVFVSATPENIGLKGSGRIENSTVVFQVLDSNGGPVANQAVRFSLNTTVGNITLSPAQGLTDNSGFAITTVSAGTVATTVRVTATTNTASNVPISSLSNRLIITSGVPDQNSFSLSTGSPTGQEDVCPNVEAFTRDGVTVQLAIRMADRFNNPVPDGTAVNFRTEAGSIEPGCSSENQSGECFVLWRSQGDRPLDGRVTILATAIGEENFIDRNGNGIYDSDPNGDGATTDAEPFDDMGEAFLDADENGLRGINEDYIDFDSSGEYEPNGGGTFTGVLCSGSLCDSTTSLNVRASTVIIMSGSNAVLGPSDYLVTGNGVNSFDSTALTLDVNENIIYTFTIIVRDARDNPMPAGTVVSMQSSGAGEAQGEPPPPTGCTTSRADADNQYEFSFKTDSVNAETPGLLDVLVTLPNQQAPQRVARINVTTRNNVP